MCVIAAALLRPECEQRASPSKCPTLWLLFRSLWWDWAALILMKSIVLLQTPFSFYLTRDSLHSFDKSFTTTHCVSSLYRQKINCVNLSHSLSLSLSLSLWPYCFSFYYFYLIVWSFLLWAHNTFLLVLLVLLCLGVVVFCKVALNSWLCYRFSSVKCLVISNHISD